MSNNISDYQIHSVNVNKNVPFEEAFLHAQNILKKKKFFHRETKNQYRFRNIPKTKFEPKTYRSKKINKDITLIFGKLKPEFRHLSGSGLADILSSGYNKLKNIFSVREDFNNVSKRTLQQYGSSKIKSLQIYRTPIINMINKALNIISLGKWDKARKELGYDKFFHLALIATVQSPTGLKNIVIEKNEVVNISTDYKTTKDTEVLNVPYNKDLTLDQFLSKTLDVMGRSNFFRYDAFNNNCQVFIKTLLSTSGLLTPEADKFIFQDLKELSSKIPNWVQPITRGITDFGAIISKLSGKGQENKGNESQALLRFKQLMTDNRKNTVMEGGAEPLDKELWNSSKKEIEKRYKKWSAYASGALVKLYKEKGGTFKGSNKPLERWFKEEWTDYAKMDYPVYRPTIRVSKQTPLTVSEIPIENLIQQSFKKQSIKGKRNLKPFSN
jgi:hypothetical protein